MKQRALNSRPIYQMLKELDEPHVPKIYRLFEREGKLIVVEEHIDGQTLEEFLIYRTVDEALAEKIFNLLKNFADYGFNKSHSAAYGFLAWQTAYLKANYPKESAYFFTICRNTEIL